eukprot:TRINITY_DN3993_c0_g1_i1.p1 TRINITY_DN3993_c0_g1~~TRINITY_DN3993_c0_g1_i1.p1  ORF type:complete len:523 (+),score=78.09 TRINITY_DN3993_c0_g1_i1:741-2309(+)
MTKVSPRGLRPLSMLTPQATAGRKTGAGAADSSTYSPVVALIYVFNLVVGTGALALPSVLTSGGWYLGSLFLLLVACLSYVGVTFMVESMAAANAILFMDGKAAMPASDDKASGTGEGDSLLAASDVEGASLGKTSSMFEIVKRTELGQMAEMFFPRWGRVFFYAALILYLFGDAAIYCTFVPRSLVGFAYGEAAPPWAFSAFLLLFVLLIVPFCFFDFQKTKVLQVGTMAIRNAALLTIVTLAAVAIWREGPRAKGVPNFKIQALPNLFGGAVYAFMCHHSLPGIITPMRQKALIPLVLKTAFIIIFVIYLMLFLSCGIAFGTDSEDPITFNFPPEKYGYVGDLLFLFPVFTLSSSFPILAITLRNNLDTLLQLLLPPRGGPQTPREKSGLLSPVASVERSLNRRIAVTLLAVAPPIASCLIAEHNGIDVNSLVGLTGAYAGAAVMFIIPACLVYCSRIATAQHCPLISVDPSASAPRLHEAHPNNPHASPFRGRKWVWALILAAILAIAFISYEKITVTG